MSTSFSFIRYFQPLDLRLEIHQLLQRKNRQKPAEAGRNTASLSFCRLPANAITQSLPPWPTARAFCCAPVAQAKSFSPGKSESAFLQERFIFKIKKNENIKIC